MVGISGKKVRILLVVRFARLVHREDHVARFGWFHAEFLHAVLDAVRHRGVDVDVQVVGHGLQDGVGTTADDDAALLLRQTEDDLLLHVEDHVLHEDVLVAEREHLVSPFGALFLPAHRGDGKLQHPGYLLDDVTIIKLDAQLPGKTFGD